MPAFPPFASDSPSNDSANGNNDVEGIHNAFSTLSVDSSVSSDEHSRLRGVVEKSGSEAGEEEGWWGQHSDVSGDNGTAREGRKKEKGNEDGPEDWEELVDSPRPSSPCPATSTSLAQQRHDAKQPQLGMAVSSAKQSKPPVSPKQARRGGKRVSSGPAIPQSPQQQHDRALQKGRKASGAGKRLEEEDVDEEEELRSRLAERDADELAAFEDEGAAKLGRRGAKSGSKGWS
ncbi:hypothetical protein JCM10213_008954 [Rhodosporidiobolus nylandii]